VGISKQHCKPVNANPFPGSGGHTMRKSANVVFIHRLRGFVTACRHLFLKSVFLFFGIV
jgi:hypothetical protein